MCAFNDYLTERTKGQNPPASPSEDHLTLSMIDFRPTSTFNTESYVYATCFAFACKRLDVPQIGVKLKIHSSEL